MVLALLPFLLRQPQSGVASGGAKGCVAGREDIPFFLVGVLHTTDGPRTHHLRRCTYDMPRSAAPDT
eukprot:COSAG05_NODE_3490_length_2029_cov_2.334715_1_plen_66_part_10